MSNKPRVLVDLMYGEIARRLMLHQDVEQISQSMSLELGTVKAILSRPDFKEKMRELEGKAYEGLDQTLKDDARNIRKQIADAAQESFDRLKLLLANAAAEGIQMKVAQDLLDRAGFGRPQETAPRQVFIINPIDADVITTALRKEAEGIQRLEGIHKILLKTPETLEHPMKEHDKERSLGATDPVTDES